MVQFLKHRPSDPFIVTYCLIALDTLYVLNRSEEGVIGTSGVVAMVLDCIGSFGMTTPTPLLLDLWKTAVWVLVKWVTCFRRELSEGLQVLYLLRTLNYPSPQPPAVADLVVRVLKCGVDLNDVMAQEDTLITTAVRDLRVSLHAPLLHTHIL